MRDALLAAQAASVVWVIGALQFPSVPIYDSQVMLVPVYMLQVPKEVVHLAPVVTQPN